MKILINNYTFDKTAKTVTFTDYTTIELKNLLLITNTTDNIIIYNFASPTKGGTVVNNILTLVYDTSAMDNGDKLQIYYDDGIDTNSLTEATNTLIAAQTDLIQTIQELSYRLTGLTSLIQSGTPALRVAPISSISTAVTGTLTAVTTVGTLTNFGTGIPAKEAADDINNMVATIANIQNVSNT